MVSDVPNERINCSHNFGWDGRTVLYCMCYALLDSKASCRYGYSYEVYEAIRDSKADKLVELANHIRGN